MVNTNEKKSVIKFNLNKTYLADEFDEAFDSGDWCGALSILNKWRDNFGCDEEYFENLIDVYDEMGEYGSTLNVWYEYIYRYGLENNASEKYEGLAVTYANLGMENESVYYYKKMISSVKFSKFPIELDADDLDFFSEHTGNLKMAYSKNNPEPSDELNEGINYARLNRLDEAITSLSKIGEDSEEYLGAANLMAICHMLKGEFDKGLEICNRILEKYPDDVQTLSNIAAIYTEHGDIEKSAEIALSLCDRSDVSADNLYRIASIACENGLDEEGLKIFLRLEKDSPFNKNNLYFIAVGAYRTGRYAMSSKYFRKLLTIYPKSSVAAYYFAAAEEGADAQKFGAAYEPIDMPYIYHLPKEERENRIRFLLNEEKKSNISSRGYNKQKEEYLEWAFDEYNGQDADVQVLAVQVAAKSHYDDFLVGLLMRYDVADAIKIAILYFILLRNNRYKFNMVVANIYCSFEVAPLSLGRKMRKQFISCTADVISRFGYFDEENIKKISAAAERLNRILSSDDVHFYVDDKSLKCAIYLLSGVCEGNWTETVRAFEANPNTVLKILKADNPSVADAIAEDCDGDSTTTSAGENEEEGEEQ